MTVRRKKVTGFAVIAAGAALVGGAMTMSAAAADTTYAHFYTGARFTGTEISADLSRAGVCQNLSRPGLSYQTLTTKDVEVYFNPGCRTGAPGESGDLYYVTGTLGGGDLPYPALSYRVRDGL